MIHEFRILDPTNGQSLVDLDFEEGSDFFLKNIFGSARLAWWMGFLNLEFRQGDFIVHFFSFG